MRVFSAGSIATERWMSIEVVRKVERSGSIFSCMRIERPKVKRGNVGEGGYTKNEEKRKRRKRDVPYMVFMYKHENIFCMHMANVSGLYPRYGCAKF